MRTLDLIKALSEDELGEVSLILSKNKRPGLILLFKELKEITQKKEEPENDKIFKKVFATPYTKQRDYLLRNELRLLNEVLYQYIAEQTFKDHISKKKSISNYWLARGYYDRGLHSIFRTDIDEFIRHASDDIPPTQTLGLSEASAMRSMKSLWMIETQLKLMENIKLQKEAVQEWREEEKKRFLLCLREMEARDAYLIHTAASLNTQPYDDPDDNRTPGETVIDLSDIARYNLFIQYLELKKYAYQTRGQVKIDVLKQTLVIIENKALYTIVGYRAYLTVLNQLSIEMFMQGDYEDGNKYLERIISDCEQNKRPASFSHIHNYLVNQINLNRYERGIMIYEQYKKTIESNRLKHAGKVFLAYCHLYLGNDDEAIKSLPREPDLPIQLQFTARFVYAIAFLMRREYLLAITELKNMKRSVKSIKSEEHSVDLTIIDLYTRFAQAYTQKPEDKEKTLSILKKQMKENKKQWTIWASVYVQLHWLMNTLNQKKI